MRTKVPVATKLMLAALVSAAILVPTASGAVVIGVGDQDPAVFADRQFRELRIGHARVVVPWDAWKYEWQIERFDRWMEAARQTGVVPLIVFGRSVTAQYRTMLPSVEDFTETFDAIHGRYPWVREYSTWNEPNHCNQPTCHNPEQVAAYYNVLRSRCSGCRVLGASMLGVDGVGKWVTRFLAVADPDPKYWGFHNYLDVNNFSRQTTRSFISKVKGEVWITETAGLVRWRVPRAVHFKTSTAHQTLAMRWLFDWLLPVTPRVTRVYLYQWRTSPSALWDSGLIAPNGKARPALSILRRVLKSGIRRPRAGEKRARRLWVQHHLNQ